MRRRILLLALSLIVVFVGGVVLCVQLFKVRLLIVAGCVKRPVAEVSMLSGIEYKKNIFSVSLNQVKDRINENPYYEVLSIRRDLPSVIYVEVEEKLALARLKTSSGTLLLDCEGYVLENREDDSGINLPVLTGLSVNTYQLGEQITLTQPMQLTALKYMLGELERQNCLEQVEEIDLSQINNILCYAPGGLMIEFGSTANLETKIRYMRAVLKDLSAKGIYQGLVNLSSGNSATYSENIYLPGEVLLLTDNVEQTESLQEAMPDGTLPAPDDTPAP